MIPPLSRRALAPRHRPQAQDREVATGLLFEITIDGADPKRCIATLTLSDALLVAPGITHAGLMFTAMERLAARVPIMLRDDARDVWLLRTASITHFRAARPDHAITLTGVIGWDGAAGEPIVVHTEACDPDGGLLAEADFTIVPVPVRRFRDGTAPALAPGGLEVVQPLDHPGRAD